MSENESTNLNNSDQVDQTSITTPPTTHKRLRKFFAVIIDPAVAYGLKRLAATQIKLHAVQHPETIRIILTHVEEGLTHKNNETRSVTALLLEEIAADTHFFVEDAAKSLKINGYASCSSSFIFGMKNDLNLFSFSNLDIISVCQNGKPLLSSAGKEFDVDWSGMSAKDRVILQKKLLKERLGCADSFGGSLGMPDFTADIVNEDDFSVASSSASISSSMSDINNETAAQIDMSNLSARQKAQLKRKSRLQHSFATDKKLKRNITPANGEDISNTNGDLTSGFCATSSNESNQQTHTNASINPWPFFPIIQTLIVNLFDANWHVRHGACLGIAALMKHRLHEFAFWAGNESACISDEITDSAIVEDLVMRLLCLLSLDRFTDFVADQTSAPVRESCAQTLAVVCVACKHAFESSWSELVGKVIENVTLLIRFSSEWQVMLSGLLGIKGLMLAFSATSDFSMFRCVADAVFDCLSCSDEDIKSLACEVLFSLHHDKNSTQSPALIEPERMFARLQSLLWEMCEAHVHTDAEVNDAMSFSLANILELLTFYFEQVPNGAFIDKLLVFMRHASLSVRASMLKILNCCIVAESCTLSGKFFASNVSFKHKLIRCLFEFVLLEEEATLKSKAQECLSLLAWDAAFSVENLLPTLFVPLGECFDAATFVSVHRASLDLFFTPSDMLLHRRSFLLASRVAATRAVAIGSFGSAIDGASAAEIEALLPTLIDGTLYRAFVVVLLFVFSARSSPFLLRFAISVLQDPTNLADASFNRTIYGVLACYLYEAHGKCTGSTLKFLLNALKDEENETLQSQFAVTTAKILLKTPDPQKLENLVFSMLEGDAAYAPRLTADEMHGSSAKFSGIWSWRRLHADLADGQMAPTNEENEAKALHVATRAVDFVVEFLVKTDANLAFLMRHEATLEKALNDASQTPNVVSQSTLNTLALVRLVVRHLHASAQPIPQRLLTLIGRFLAHESGVLRWAAASSLLEAHVDSLPFIVEHFLDGVKQKIADVSQPNDWLMHGVAELVFLATHEASLFACAEAAPFAVFFVGPVLRCVTAPDAQVRFCAFKVFSVLLRIVPLQATTPRSFADMHLSSNGGGMTFEAAANAERTFLEQLFSLRKVADAPLELPFELPTPLRPYQQEGVKWMLFLQKYALNGALCDDMGLGKTLQTLCAVAAATLQHRQKAHSSDSQEQKRLPPSLIVAPASITGHWEHEAAAMLGSGLLRTHTYVGATAQRRATWQTAITSCDLLITTYEVVRADADLFSRVPFFYVVLDEAHIIRNSRTKLAAAVKSISAAHRLVLSGTPIQNNVTELWSLFDFLMPGFLGTETHFNATYARAVAASKEAKAATAEFRAAQSALEALHRACLPFVLRRLKEDVLRDLPPKIIQDVVVDMTAEQAAAHAAFVAAMTDVEAVSTSSKSKGGKKSVLHALHVLRRLCIHPALLEAAEGSGGDSPAISLQTSPKLQALHDLLLACGINDSIGGGASCEVVDDAAQMASEPHRVLIFVQRRETLRIVENAVLRAAFPAVPYAVLDGSVEASKRYAVASRFNADSAVRVLLLTTHVGGVGLTLTGADTVIFVEHDWNPMRDLQAMDRVHRLGQRRTVNVYRLLLRHSVEERIMSMQRFKLHVAHSVVTQQNVALSSMASASASGAGSDDDDDEAVADVFGAVLAAGSSHSGSLHSVSLNSTGGDDKQTERMRRILALKGDF